MGLFQNVVKAIAVVKSEANRSQDFVVVDVETTGLSSKDRIVEVSAVVVDGRNYKVIDEFDTLVNPLRDVGPTGIHGITASMVESAPTFEDVAVALGNILDGRILVAHNLSFDKRFLSQEFERLDGVFDFGHGVCTLRLCGDKLVTACSRRGIQITQHHRSLADARATAELLKFFGHDLPETKPMYISPNSGTWKTMTLRRDALDENLKMPVTRNFRTFRFPTSSPNYISYLDILDTYLDDLVLTNQEKESLAALARDLQIDSAQIFELHSNYFDFLLRAAQRDNKITAAEHETLLAVAQALDLSISEVPDISDEIKLSKELDGLRVCFTGEAVVEGKTLKREQLESLAAKMGMQPVSSVTKSNCDLLVASDTSSMSGKAKKAMQYKIPIISVADFLKEQLLIDYLKNF